MISDLSRSHRLAKTVSKWFSILLGLFCVYGWVMLSRGNWEIDLELDGGFELNGYLVIGFVAIVLALILYGLSFILTYGSLFIASKIKTH
jgi:hypothetical protein